ncbi:hypothetical protein Tco_0962731, partial [Tanacetum coccineum]
MDTTRAQQQALDDELVAPADLVLYALKLTPFYNAFEISADVPEIYMQEFWVTVSRHHSSFRFKLNGKSYTVNVDNFRDMLKISPKLHGQKFEEPPLEEDILSFIRDLGHTGKIKFLSDINVNHKHQPWRSFAAIINKCLSRKTMALESLRLSRAQILWGMYHNKKVDYVYLLWEDLVFQVENKNSKKNNDIVISKHQDTQVYGSILPQHLTNQAMLESKAYMTYRAYATGEKTPKPKTTKKKADSETSIDKGLTVLSDVALTKAEQLKLVIERSKTQTHNSHASSSGVDKGTGVKPGVPDVPLYNSDDEQISWKSSDEEDDDEVSLNNDDDDFSTHDDDAKQDEEVNEEDSFDPRVQTPSHVESTDDESNEESDEEVQGANTEEEEMEEEATHEEDEANELYRDVNVNLEGRDTAMTDAPLPNVQATQETEDTHVILTAPINPEGQKQSSSM